MTRTRDRWDPRAQDGSITVFALFIFVAMVACLGLAVDVARAELLRVRVQATLDRAVVAASDLQQRLDPEQVVRHHFAAAGLEDMLGQVSVSEENGRRAVHAEARQAMPTILMRMLGVDTLPVGAWAAAEERVTNVEISLVLDASGSMGSHGRMENMRVAATEFVRQVLPDPDEGASDASISINLVPYATSVNLGSEIFDLVGVAREHGRSHCVQFDDAAFDDPALPPANQMRQHDHFTSSDQHDARGTSYRARTPRDISLPLCPRGDDELALRPFASDRDALVSAITALAPHTATGMDAGMLWGITLLDPSMRSVASTLIDRGRVSADLAGRPLDYDAPDSMKIAVLMTDGKPDAERGIAPALSGLSNVWYDTHTNTYSVLVRGRNLRSFPYDVGWAADEEDDCEAIWDEDDPIWGDGGPDVEDDGVRRVAAGNQDDDCAPRWYWVRDDDGRIEQEWRLANPGWLADHPRTRHTDPEDRNDWTLFAPDVRDPDAEPNSSHELVRLTYRELFDRFTVWDAGVYLYYWPSRAGWLSSAEWSVLWNASHRGSLPGSVARIKRLCEAAKAKGVLIYTVGFELDALDTEADRERARDIMRQCASTAEHFFDVDGLEISKAFGTIAEQLSQLRLTR